MSSTIFRLRLTPPISRLRLSPHHKTYVAATTGPQAEVFKAAMAAGRDNISHYQTFVPCRCPDGITPVRTTWILTRKLVPDGTAKTKALLVGRGDLQPSDTYSYTHFPVAPLSAFLAIVVVGLQKGHFIGQFGIKVVYLSAPLHNPVYVRPPSPLPQRMNPAERTMPSCGSRPLWSPPK